MASMRMEQMSVSQGGLVRRWMRKKRLGRYVLVCTARQRRERLFSGDLSFYAANQPGLAIGSFQSRQSTTFDLVRQLSLDGIGGFTGG